MSDPPLEIELFTDVLCVWAYAGQIRNDELRDHFGARIRIVERYLNVYGDVRRRIDDKAEGDAEAYARAKRDVAARFDHTKMHPDAFTKVVPRSSNMAHLALCAVRAAQQERLVATDPQLLSRLTRRIRLAFFEEAQDVGQSAVLLELLHAEGVPREPVEATLTSGAAMAELSDDLAQKERLGLIGSPTYVLDGGREKLFGNVGYRILEANVVELLASDGTPTGSWC